MGQHKFYSILVHLNFLYEYTYIGVFYIVRKYQKNRIFSNQNNGNNNTSLFKAYIVRIGGVAMRFGIL